MSNKALDYVFTHSKTKGSARVLMLAIADMANDDGECYPGRANLAKKVNVSERQLSNLVRDCEVMGELRVYQRSHSAEDHRTNKYYIVGLYDEKRAAKTRTAKARKAREFPKPAEEIVGHGKLVALGGHGKRVASGQRKLVASASAVGHGKLVATNPSLTSLTIDPKIAAEKAGGDMLEDKTPEQLFDEAAANGKSKAPAIPLVIEEEKKGRANPHFDVIVELFGVDYASLTKTEQSGIGKVAAELKKSGRSVDDIRTIYKYCVKKEFNGFTWHALTAHASMALRGKSMSAAPVTPPVIDTPELTEAERLEAAEFMRANNPFAKGKAS
jgi:hypothetical protein